MPAPADISPTNLAIGLTAKRRNALTATLFGALLTALLLLDFSFKPGGFLIGIPLGLLYANAFEYFLHRLFLHAPGRTLAKYHEIHHATWGTPDEPLYVNFAKNPLVVVLLFFLNALPIALADYAFRGGFAPGMMIGFVAYFVAYEEIHWRIHLGGRLPSWLEPARRHHLTHHAAAQGRFNIFLPLFDLLFAHLPHPRKSTR